TINSTINVSSQINNIPILNGTNFKVWKEVIETVLNYVDLDLALWIEKNCEEVKIEKWIRFHRMCLMIMKHSIPKAFWNFIYKSQSARKCLKELNNSLPKMKRRRRYKGKENIRDYIMDMSNLVSKLKSLNLELACALDLISLPAHFRQLKVSYNTQKDKWSLNKLISHCVQVEERL
ncbi:hypothetical protein CR513_44603, partial [Mucuna pruriens]